MCIVGRILDVVESAAKLTFRIHDNTGELEALMHSPTGSDGDEVVSQDIDTHAHTQTQVYRVSRHTASSVAGLHRGS